jgi:hypothetical protein
VFSSSAIASEITLTEAALYGRLFTSLSVQDFLLVCQSAPRGFHSHQGELPLLVFGSFS